MCVGFLSEEAELCLLSLLLGVGLAFVGLFWCGFCASSWGTCGFPWRVLQLVTLSGFCNFLAPVSWPTPAVDVCCWVGGVLGHHLVFYLVPAQLPLPQLNLAGFVTFLAPVCWPTPAVEPCCWVGGVYGASLGSLPCAMLSLRGLQFAQLTLQQVPLGIFCLFCHRVPVLLLPWWRMLPGNPSLLFSVRLLLRLACRGSLGSAPCVRVLQGLFGRQYHHPACFLLP